MQSHTSQKSPTAHLQQLQQALIRRKEVEQLTALSRSRIYGLLQQGLFPKPVRLGAMSVAWVREEVIEWIESRIAERNRSDAAEQITINHTGRQHA